MMAKNMDHSLGLVFSQQVLLALIEGGLTREEAYDLVQPLAMQAWREQSSFFDLVSADPGVTRVLSREEITGCFDPGYHSKYVDLIFQRLGL
jgi:adenylosuccinate lyase